MPSNRYLQHEAVIFSLAGIPTALRPMPGDFDGDTVNKDITLYAKWKTVPGSAGGIVFYDKGSYSDGWRYLEVTTDDLSTGTVWGEYGTEVTGTGAGIGSGKSNTEKIVAALGEGDYAAKLCYDLNSGGHQDWFLPSMDELHELYNQSGTVGHILSGEYWTSTGERFQHSVGCHLSWGKPVQQQQEWQHPDYWQCFRNQTCSCY